MNPIHINVVDNIVQSTVFDTSDEDEDADINRLSDMKDMVGSIFLK